MNLSLARPLANPIPRRTWPGLVASACVGMLAMQLSHWPIAAHHGLGGLAAAVILGMLVGNLFSVFHAKAEPGLVLARGPLLRIGIVLFGLQIGSSELHSVGWGGFLVALGIVGSTLPLAVWFGTRVLGLDRRTCLLIGAGSAICGAAAVAAADGVLRASSKQVTAAVFAVVLFGSLAMLVMPNFYPLAGLSAAHFGMWVGASVHELGQVVAATSTLGSVATSAGVVEKMLRVALLAPAMLAIGQYERNAEQAQGHHPRVPLFVWCFIAVVAGSMLGLIPDGVRAVGNNAAQWMMAAALAALGASVRFATLRELGMRVWLLAAGLWIYLMCAAYGLVWLTAGRG